MSTIKIKPTDVLNDAGELAGIEYHDQDGVFQFQALWDPNDEHTPLNIANFRVWCAKMATRLDYILEE